MACVFSQSSFTYVTQGRLHYPEVGAKKSLAGSELEEEQSVPIRQRKEEAPLTVPAKAQIFMERGQEST